MTQAPRRVLRREVVFVGEEDWLPNDDDDIDTDSLMPTNSGLRGSATTRTTIPLVREISIFKGQPFCRICLSDETDDIDLGRLFTPCRCRGSMQVTFSALFLYVQASILISFNSTGNLYMKDV